MVVFADGGFFDIGSGYGHCPGPLSQMQIGPSERTTGGSANAWAVLHRGSEVHTCKLHWGMLKIPPSRKLPLHVSRYTCRS